MDYSSLGDSRKYERSRTFHVLKQLDEIKNLPQFRRPETAELLDRQIKFVNDPNLKIGFLKLRIHYSIQTSTITDVIKNYNTLKRLAPTDTTITPTDIYKIFKANSFDYPPASPMFNPKQFRQFAYGLQKILPENEVLKRSSINLCLSNTYPIDSLGYLKHLAQADQQGSDLGTIRLYRAYQSLGERAGQQGDPSLKYRYEAAAQNLIVSAYERNPNIWRSFYIQTLVSDHTIENVRKAATILKNAPHDYVSQLTFHRAGIYSKLIGKDEAFLNASRKTLFDIYDQNPEDQPEEVKQVAMAIYGKGAIRLLTRTPEDEREALAQRLNIVENLEYFTNEEATNSYSPFAAYLLSEVQHILTGKFPENLMEIIRNDSEIKLFPIAENIAIAVAYELTEYLPALQPDSLDQVPRLREAQKDLMLAFTFNPIRCLTLLVETQKAMVMILGNTQEEVRLAQYQELLDETLNENVNGRHQDYGKLMIDDEETRSRSASLTEERLMSTNYDQIENFNLVTIAGRLTSSILPY